MERHNTKIGQRSVRYAMPIMGTIIILALILGVFVYFPKQQTHAAANATQPARPTAATPSDWPMYLGNKERTNYNGNETTITATTVPNLKTHWTYSTGGVISAQPLVTNSMVYWGSWDGNEYATTLSGKKLWSTFISSAIPDCTPPFVFGVGSTPTINDVSINGKTTSVAFVGGNDSIYALNAMTGVIIWKTVIGPSPTHSFIWSSPVYYKGSIYVGISSVDDCPLVQGGFAQLDAVTGAILHVFNTVPNGCTGGSIWGSPAIDQTTGTIYVVTGNAGVCATPEIYGSAFLSFRASDLSLIDSWQVPKNEQIGDSDFGTSPTLFTATIGGTPVNAVGAINKSGIYYALDRTSLHTGPLWRAYVSAGRVNIGSAAWDGTTLYIAGRNTIINGAKCTGSIRAVNPSIGAFIWELCLNKSIYAAVSAVPGVVFVSAGWQLIAVSATTGQILYTYKPGHPILGTSSISNGVLYIGDESGTLSALGL